MNHDQRVLPAGWSALTLTAPVAMGYVPLGIVYGFLFVQAGGQWWIAVLCSLLVFAGAAQYMAIPMMATGMSLASIAIATLAVNLRHLFYGLSLLHKVPVAGPMRWYLIFSLTDETYSLITTLPDDTPKKQLMLVAMFNHAWWILGTVLGAVLGAQARINLHGLDFCLASLFAVLTVEQWRMRKSSLPLWIALAAFGAMQALIPSQALVCSMALCIVIGTAYRPNQTSSNPPETATGGQR